MDQHKATLEVFTAALLSIHPTMGKEAFDYLLQNSRVLTAPLRSILIEEGKLQQHLFFLVDGLVRAYYIDKNGEEITVRFVDRAGWITHYSALLTNTPSKYFFQALEKSTMVVLPREVVQKGYLQFRDLEKFGRLIAEQVLIAQQSRIEDFQFLNAEERYLKFIKDHPDLFNKVSLSHLSTYLGIKRQSLTRIRKKLMDRYD